jgi:PAS domain S-box-containing protein
MTHRILHTDTTATTSDRQFPSGPGAATAKHLDRWLNEHQASILKRWMESGELEHGLPFPVPSLMSPSELRARVLGALTAPPAVAELLDTLTAWIDEEDAAIQQALNLPAWHFLLEGLRQSILAELLAAPPPEHPFELLLAIDNALSSLIGALTRWQQQQLDRLAQERDRFKCLYGVTLEIASNLDLDRVARGALDGGLRTTGAEFGLLLILDRESGRLFPWASSGWDVGVIEPDWLPDDWTQGWRSEVIPPIDDVSALVDAGWRKVLQVPAKVSALIVAPIVANGEFYGMIVLGSPQPGRFAPADIQSVKAITAQVAGVSENAEIYRLINRQAQELGSMLRHQQEEASKSQAILESIADGVVVNNSQGQVILMNPAAERILSRSRENLLASDVRHLIEGFDDPGRTAALAVIEDMLTRASSPAQIKVSSVLLERGNRVISAHLAPVIARHDEFLGVVTIYRDITKEVEADRAKSEFISTVSHELRTPMTAIKGYTDLLFGGAVGALSENQKHFLQVIQNNTGRLIALINDLLDISRIETGRVRFEPAPVKLGEVIAGVVEAMAARAKERALVLSYEVDAGLPEVMGDHDRLYQVLTNLVGNAINYTPEGSITVEATSVDMAVQVSVHDTGVGIDPEDVARIFDRFYRGDDPVVQEASGTGLGLSIVKMFVEMHGGRVWVASEKGKGSTFTFILPVPGAELKEEESASLPLTPPPITAKTVLVVDDDADIAQLVRLQLESNGYRVLTANRGTKALKLIEEEERVDLIVLDRLLPDTDGLALLDTVKSDPATAEIPVIILTIVEDDGDAMQRGASAYLVKPVNEQLLLDQVEAVLTRQGRVLVVEDDDDTVDMLSRALRRVGFITDTARDGYEALAAARRVRPDVILLDLRLPGMDGYEALSHLKRNISTSAIPIIAISAHVTNPVAERERLIMLGATDFLLKPLKIEELIKTVDRAMDCARGRQLSDEPSA